MMARLLAWIVGAELASDICGDLMEERARRAAASRVGAVLWFWRTMAATTLGAAAATLGHGLRRRRRRLLPPGGGRHESRRMLPPGRDRHESRRLLPPGGGGHTRRHLFPPGGGRHEWRHALRSLRRAPWYALTAAGVIALSMAFAATIFSIVDGVLFKPLPYPAADRLFTVFEPSPGGQVPDANGPAIISAAQVDAWSKALPDVRFAYYFGSATPNFALRGTQYDGVASWARVDAGFFETIGVGPMTGGFVPEDFAVETPIRSAVISYEFWQRWFGGDRSAIGQTLSGESGTSARGIRVVGILPRDFVPPWGFPVDFVTPIVASGPDDHVRRLHVVARLPEGLNDGQASGRLSDVAAALVGAWPLPQDPDLRMRDSPVSPVTLQPIRAVLTHETGGTSRLVFAAALSLMGIGCLNVAGLAAARVQDRWRDLVLRRALGARPGDLIRLLGIESAVVVLAGTIAGVASAVPLLRVTVGLLSSSTQFLKVPAVDLRVLAFSGLVAAGSVALITAVAANAVLRTTADTALAEAPTASRRGRWRSWSLVGGQVALALVMAVGGALVAGSLLRVWGEDPGFDLGHTAAIGMNPPDGTAAAEIEELMAGLRRLPGVVHAGSVVAGMVVGMDYYGSYFDPPPGILPPTEAGGPRVASMAVTSGYLESAGLRPIDGRLPSDAELQDGAPVLVVSESLAREYWPGRRAVGQVLLGRPGTRVPARPFTVVGVVPDARYAALDRDPYGAIYWPNAVSTRPLIGNVLLRLADDSPTSPADAAAWIRRGCPDCLIYGEPRMLAELFSDTVRDRALHALLFASFGIASLLIVGVGILGLVAMTSSRRTKEIGIRLALGATPRGVTRLILGEQIVAVLLGLAAGGLVAAWAVQFVGSYLYKLQLYDFRAWGAAIGALLLIAALGAVVPALRASRVDPVWALRAD